MRLLGFLLFLFVGAAIAGIPPIPPTPPAALLNQSNEWLLQGVQPCAATSNGSTTVQVNSGSGNFCSSTNDTSPYWNITLSHTGTNTIAVTNITGYGEYVLTLWITESSSGNDPAPTFTGITVPNAVVLSTSANTSTPIFVTFNGTSVVSVSGGVGMSPYNNLAEITTYGNTTSAQINLGLNLTQYGVVYGGGASGPLAATAAGTAGYVLTANSGAAPSFQSPAAWSGGLSFPGTMTATATGTGLLTGTYYYTVTYLTASGETDYSVGGVSASPSSQEVSLTNIPVSASSSVIARNIYRTAATAPNQYEYQFLTKINDNTTTSYTDNTADASLGNYAPAFNTATPYVSGTPYGPLIEFGNISLFIGAYTNQALQGGYADVAIGPDTLQANTGGIRDTAVGVDALVANTTGNDNTAVGTHALNDNTIGNDNVAVGYTALFAQTGNTTASSLNGPAVAIGSAALNNINTTGGSASVAVGYEAMANASGASTSVAVGYEALAFGTGSYGYDTAIGFDAMQNISGSNNGNTAIGAQSLGSVSGAENTALGRKSGLEISSGANNMCLGYESCSTTLATGSNNIVLSAGSTGKDTYASSTSNELNINNVIRGGMAALTSASLSLCGTSPTITAASSDLGGTFTTGSGASACTLTLAQSTGTAPSCLVTARNGTAPAYSTADNGTTATLTLSAAVAGATYDYWCPTH